MIYQTVITVTPDTQTYPVDSGPGFDRLSYSFPFPYRNELIEDLVNAGLCDRYFGPHDSITSYDDRIVIKLVWKTKEAADSWAVFLTDKPGVLSAESIEFSE